jgi:hypothetical protein
MAGAAASRRRPRPVVLAGPFLPAAAAPVREPLVRAHVHDEPQRRPRAVRAILLVPVHVLDDGVPQPSSSP